MDWDNLEQRELLEQYLLGLTDRKQTAIVEEMLRNDPQLAKDLEMLRGRMTDYIADQGLKYEGPARQRTSEDFHDLDHEMITEMTRRNHHLVIWRLALSAACLLLLFLSGYLFRENQNYRIAVDREKAMHAEDEESARRKIEALRHTDIPLDSLRTEAVSLAGGTILLHYLPEDQAALLDLSHLPAPGAKHVYTLTLHGHAGEQTVVPISDSLQGTLLPVKPGIERVRLWQHDTTPVAETPPSELLADIPMRFGGENSAKTPD